MELAQLKPDYMGFIFYEPSARFIGRFDESWLPALAGIKRTAVFVDAPENAVLEQLRPGLFQAVQFHGQESPEYCHSIGAKTGVEVIKAFGIHDRFDWQRLDEYSGCVDFFLFDAYTRLHGGSGKTFNWQLLDAYRLQLPYFLSGGLGPQQVSAARAIRDSRLYGLDLNSRFESEPGIKDIELLKTVFEG